MEIMDCIPNMFHVNGMCFHLYHGGMVDFGYYPILKP